MAKKAAVIMGSDSDWPIVQKAVSKLKSFGVETEVHVMSAHRTPEEACAFAKNAEAQGFGVIIAAAGMAAHLGGVLAAYTTLPVIGVPMATSVIFPFASASVFLNNFTASQAPSGAPYFSITAAE